MPASAYIDLKNQMKRLFSVIASKGVAVARQSHWRDAAADKSDTDEGVRTRTFPARRGGDYNRNPFCN